MFYLNQFGIHEDHQFRQGLKIGFKIIKNKHFAYKNQMIPVIFAANILDPLFEIENAFSSVNQNDGVITIHFYLDPHSYD